ncbi:MAG TPA: hypothetical protein V6D21_01880 [Candidatus Obscuribacterales bacterium]
MPTTKTLTVPQVGDWVEIKKPRKGRSFLKKGSVWQVENINLEKQCLKGVDANGYSTEYLWFDEIIPSSPPLVKVEETETEPKLSQSFDPAWDDPNSIVNKSSLGDSSTLNGLGDNLPLNDLGDSSTLNDLGDTSTLNDLGDGSTLNDEQAIATIPDLGDTSTLNMKKLLLWAGELPEKELNQVIDALVGLRAARFPTGEETSTPTGAIEYKMINGCGPYKYLRYWSGGRHRSVYLGKAG